MQNSMINQNKSRIIGDKDKNIFIAKGISSHKKTNIVPNSFFKRHKKTEQNLIDSKQRELEKKLESVIGKPFFSDQGFILYKGDCLNLMSQIVKSDIRVNLTVTSPPYNIGKEYETNKPIENFTKWCIEWMNLIYTMTKKNGKFRRNPLGKNPSDVWEFPKVTSGFKRSSRERTVHPAQFPLRVVERVILGYSNFKDIVLDPFSGSASTGIAAYGTGRIYLGIELRPDYCEMSIERYKNFRRTKQEINSQLSLV